MKNDWIQELAARVAPLRLRPEREAEIIDELSQHLDDQVRELISGGAEPDAAIRQALAELDAPGVLTERLGRIEAPSPYVLPPPGAPSHGRWFAARWLDLRHSIRSLRRTPAFTATVVVTMALTIGPTTAMLSIGNWLVWRPVPAVSDANRLGVVYFGRWNEDGRGVSPNRVSPQNIADLLAASRTIEALAGTQESLEGITIGGQLAENMGAAHADANLFATLGIRPSAGRFFNADEDVLPYGALVAVVSDGLARRVFGSPEGAIGQTLLLNGRRLSIVGVAPEGFRGITPFSIVDVWYPGAAYRFLHHFQKIPPATRRDGTFYSFVVRLRPGATADNAQAELNVLAPGLAERYPTENAQFKTIRARLFPGMGPSALTRDTYRTMVQRLLLIGAVLVALGCANVANLLIFRGVRREREHALRMALGAGRARLLQLQLTESCLLTIAGAALGVALASALTKLILTLVLPGAYAAGIDLTVPIDARVLAATLAVSIACGIAAGLIPAWMSVGQSMVRGLAQAAARGTPRGRRLRTGFAVVQLALSLALLVGALLMTTTVRRLAAIDPGFDVDGVSLHSMDLASQGYTLPRALQYLRDLDAALSSTPGLTAAFSYTYPFGSTFGQRIQAPGTASVDPIEVKTNGISANYFAALGIPIVKGRSFTAEETMTEGDRNAVVVVSRSLARRLFGDSDPLGRTVTEASSGRDSRPLVIVGVAEDVSAELASRGAELTVYQPIARSSLFAVRPVVLVKSALTARAASEAVRAIAARIDPTVPVAGNRALRTQTIDRQLSGQRVFAWVLSLLGGFGFVLAAVGLYGLLAQAVTERTREFGIRLAMGATPRQIYSLVLRYAALVAGIGGVVGVAAAVAGSRLIESQLWGVTTSDPSIYALAALALAAVVFVAAAWPARLATQIEPVEALKLL
jgi:putative ABC transport system permease protein